MDLKELIQAFENIKKAINEKTKLVTIQKNRRKS